MFEKLHRHPYSHEEGQTSTKHAETLRDLTSKRLILLPLEFEATINQHLHTYPAALTNPEALLTIISNAQRLSVPRKTYALFADIVLSSTYPTSTNTNAENNSNNNLSATPRLPLSTSATLISQIVTAIRTLPDYDTVRASRWIRCLVQKCLDRHNQKSIPHHHHLPSPKEQENHSPAPLALVEDVIEQAITLARQTLHQQQSKPRHAATGASPLYPSEELEWLSTTLFNLGIDFYVSSGSSSHQSPGTEHPPDTQPRAEAKKWITLAIEIADLIAAYPYPPDPKSKQGGEEQGDGGLLARLLRAKVGQGLGWRI